MTMIKSRSMGCRMADPNAYRLAYSKALHGMVQSCKTALRQQKARRLAVCISSWCATNDSQQQVKYSHRWWWSQCGTESGKLVRAQGGDGVVGVLQVLVGTTEYGRYWRMWFIGVCERGFKWPRTDAAAAWRQGEGKRVRQGVHAYTHRASALIVLPEAQGYGFR